MTVTTCHTAAMTHIGERIREAREARGMTQAELAKKIGAPSPSITKQFEHRATLPSRASVYTERIEHVLGIVLDEKADRNRPYDPPVSEAPSALLMDELSRRPDSDALFVAEFARRLGVASAEGQAAGQGTVAPFGVRRMSTSDDGQGRTGDG